MVDVNLTADQAEVVAQGLVEAAWQRHWQILRGAVMYNHVHVVVTDCPDDAAAVRRILKGNAQAELSRYVGQPRRWWPRGGSDRYLHTETAIRAALDYVAKQKGILAEIVDSQVFDRD